MMKRENLYLMTVSANLRSQIPYTFISLSKFPHLTFLLGGINQGCLHLFFMIHLALTSSPSSPSLHKAVLLLNNSIFIHNVSL